jgi:NAD kinase
MSAAQLILGSGCLSVRQDEQCSQLRSVLSGIQLEAAEEETQRFSDPLTPEERHTVNPCAQGRAVSPPEVPRLPHVHTASEVLEQLAQKPTACSLEWRVLHRPLLPASYRNIYLRWSRPVRHILILFTVYSDSARSSAVKICQWLEAEYPELILYSETEHTLPGTLHFPREQTQTPIDLVICLGGDGLVLHACASLFPKAAPPLMPFHLGSLGFLTPFPFNNFPSCVREVMRGSDVTVTLRMRLDCAIYKDGDGQRPLIQKTVLNEVVVDRGPAPFLSNLECYCDDFPVTRIQADGVILATPTGSTAYSLSSNGSMVHPSVPAILLTPICPHSLSFRPVIFPDYVTLKIRVSRHARGSAWVSFDGRARTELQRGDYLRVQISPWPLATLNYNDQTQDWFRSVSRCLRWNERPMQRLLSLEGNAWEESPPAGASPRAPSDLTPPAGTGSLEPAPATPLDSFKEECGSPDLVEPEREASTFSRIANAFRSPPEWFFARSMENDHCPKGDSSASR